MKEPKICPFLAAGPIGINTNCKEERCAFWGAWYCGSSLFHECAVVTIADALDTISDREDIP